VEAEALQIRIKILADKEEGLIRMAKLADTLAL
jgi:hypothetical protein